MLQKADLKLYIKANSVFAFNRAACSNVEECRSCKVEMNLLSDCRRIRHILSDQRFNRKGHTWPLLCLPDRPPATTPPSAEWACSVICPYGELPCKTRCRQRIHCQDPTIRKAFATLFLIFRNVHTVDPRSLTRLYKIRSTSPWVLLSFMEPQQKEREFANRKSPKNRKTSQSWFSIVPTILILPILIL